jgi:hypothetical protein
MNFTSEQLKALEYLVKFADESEYLQSTDEEFRAHEEAILTVREMIRDADLG